MVERAPNTQYILSLSYGKDSLAAIEACIRLGYPIDRIVHAEVWATDTIPADLPPMVAFKDKADRIIKERYGLDVEHVCATRPVTLSSCREREREREREQANYSSDAPTRNGSMRPIVTHQPSCTSLARQTPSTDGRHAGSCGATASLKSPPSTERERLTYEKLFYHVPKRKNPARIAGGVRFLDSRCSKGTGVQATSKMLRFEQGTINGFPSVTRRCVGALKTDAIRNLRIPLYRRELVQKTQTVFSTQRREPGAKINTVQYLGIAADEPKRIERHSKPGFVLPLVDIGWTEAECRKWCEDNDLLSPIYTTSARGGCWFCHNQCVGQLRILRHDYPELWALLLKWDADSPVTFHADGHTVHDFDRRFALEDEGAIKAGDRFSWDVLNKCQLNMFMFLDKGE